jgi:hypothetical protein
MTALTAAAQAASTGESTRRMPMLLSVNVGVPRNVPWQGKTVYTGVWKHPVDGPAMVRRLNIDGDGQGDTNGYGGERNDGAGDRPVGQGARGHGPGCHHRTEITACGEVTCRQTSR